MSKSQKHGIEHLHDDDPWCDWCDQEFEEGQTITTLEWEFPSFTIPGWRSSEVRFFGGASDG